jgi:hypothetical protein
MFHVEHFGPGGARVGRDLKTYRRRYEGTERGLEVRAAWKGKNKPRLYAYVVEHRRKMRLLEEAGTALRLRWPLYTGTGDPGPGPAGPSPAAAGASDRSAKPAAAQSADRKRRKR